MVPDAVLFSRTKEFEEAGHGYFRLVSKQRADLRTIHDENDVLTDGELVVARDFLKKSKYASLYIQNEFPHRFKLLSHI